MSVSDVRCSEREAGIVEHYRGAMEVLYLRPKLNVEIVLDDADSERAIDVILTRARTGEPGDGKIFLLPVGDAIRTAERGSHATEAHLEPEAQYTLESFGTP